MSADDVKMNRRGFFGFLASAPVAIVVSAEQKPAEVPIAAMTAAWREAFDAGMYTNFPLEVSDPGHTHDITPGPHVHSHRIRL